jgi:pilus assembly protein Flp/PilA
MKSDGSSVHAVNQTTANESHEPGETMNNLRFLIARTCLGLRTLTPVELEREEGQTLAEYGLILALIALVVIVAVTVLGGQINGMFEAIGSKI